MVNPSIITLIICLAVVIIALILDMFISARISKKIKKRISKLKNKKLSYNQLLTYKNNYDSNHTQRTAILVTLILILATIFFSTLSLNTQIKLSDQNIKFLEQTTSSNWAHLEIKFGRPYENRIIIDAQKFSTHENDIKKRVRIPIIMINSGKVNTGKIQNIGYGKDKNIHTVLGESNHKYIDISSQNGISEIVYLTDINCENQEFENGCNFTKLPHKEYDLNLRISCEFCEPQQRIMNLSIPLCIYHNSEEYNYCIKYSEY